MGLLLDGTVCKGSSWCTHTRFIGNDKISYFCLLDNWTSLYWWTLVSPLILIHAPSHRKYRKKNENELLWPNRENAINENFIGPSALLWWNLCIKSCPYRIIVTENNTESHYKRSSSILRKYINHKSQFRIPSMKDEKSRPSPNNATDPKIWIFWKHDYPFFGPLRLPIHYIWNYFFAVGNWVESSNGSISLQWIGHEKSPFGVNESVKGMFRK